MLQQEIQRSVVKRGTVALSRHPDGFEIFQDVLVVDAEFPGDLIDPHKRSFPRGEY